MNTVQGDIFDYLGIANAICIPTNMIVDKFGAAVMGAGVALAAKKKFPGIDRNLGYLLKKQYQPCVNLIYNFEKTKILSFPTKADWRKKSLVDLIDKSAYELWLMTNRNKWTDVVLPPPGCGNGGLDFQHEVLPILMRYFDERFTVVGA